MAGKDGLYGSRMGRMFGWRHMFVLLAILAVTAGIGAVRPACADPVWVSQVVEGSHLPDGGTSIAVQATGQVHVGYQGAAGGVMKYASNAYGWNPSWTPIQTVVGVLNGTDQTRENSSLAVDSAGNVHVCYYDTYYHAVMYATNSSGNWVAQQLEGNGGDHSAITADSDNHVHILTIDSSQQVRYWTADPASGLSAPETLDDHGSGFVQVAADSGGHAHALYTTTGGELRHTTNASGSWATPELVEASVSLHSQMALCIGAAGHAHAAYASGGTLRYATNADSGTWAAEDVDATLATGDPVAVFVTTDAQGKATIDSFSPATGKITRTSNASGVWLEAWSESVVGPASTTDASIVTDKDNVHLVYTKTATDELIHVTNAVDPQGADVQVTQTRTPATVMSRQQVQYTVTATNLGAEDATGVVLVDDLPAGATFVSATNGTYDVAKHQVTWNIGNPPKGEPGVTTTITVAAPSSGTMTNKATVCSTQGQDFKTANNVVDDSNSPVSIIVPQHPLVLLVANEEGGTLAPLHVQAMYEEGSIVPVTATPDPGYRVKSWQGTVDDSSTSSGNAVRIGPGESTTVQVQFEVIPRQLIAVAGGGGSIDPLSGIYPDGTLVTLTATPKPHYKVKKWTGTDHDSWTSDGNNVTMDADRTVTVEFEPAPNQTPVAMADLPSVACSGDQVVLDGSDSYDPDQDPLTYKWEANDVTLDDSTAVQASFTAPSVQEGLMVEVSLTVSDGQLADKQVYVLKVKPASIPGGPRCPGEGVGAGNLVCFYCLCWLGLACMKWGPRIRRGRR